MTRQIRLLAQADLLLLIADLLRPPEKTPHLLQSLSETNLKMLVDATGLQAQDDLCQQLRQVVELARQADGDEWSGCYRLLFDGSIICPVNEAGYIRRDKGSILGDVCGFYHAFGWTAVEQTGERADHLLVELEFVAMLLVMLARAETREQAALTESALADFSRHHLSDWLFIFCDQLKHSTSYPLFVQSANLLASFWQAIVNWHEWTIDPPAASTVGIGEEPENPYECGAPDLVDLKTDVNR